MSATTELERELNDHRTAALRLWNYLDLELDAERIAEVTAHFER